MKNKLEGKSSKKKAAALFIPGGLLIGMGIGFLLNQLVAGLFIGLGAGFIIFALILLLEK